MDGEADHTASLALLLPAEKQAMGRLSARLWQWLGCGFACTAILSTIAWFICPFFGLEQLPPTLHVAISGITLSLFAALWAHHRQVRQRASNEGRKELHGIARALVTMADDPEAGWRMLQHYHVIDGYAVWDAQDRLVLSAGFLNRYLPHLREWQLPTIQQVATELVQSNLVLLPPGTDKRALVEAYCRQRREIPGLREFQMVDGRHYMARTAPLGDGRHVSIFTDLTKMVRWGEGAMLPDRLFRSAYEHSGAMLVILGTDAVPLAVNRTFSSILGYSLDELKEIGWPGILHSDEGRPGIPWTPGPHWFKTALGQRMRGLVRLSSIRDENHIASGNVLVGIEDVTAHWENDHRLRLQGALLDSLGSAVLAVDRNGRIIYCNTAAASLFQWSTQMLQLTPVDQILGTGIRNAIIQGQREVKCDGLTWNGGVFPASVTIAPLGDEKNDGAVLVIADQTKQRTLDLQFMHSARLATLGEMAASIAHEFNQCLHVIRLSAEAIRLESDQPPVPTILAKRSDSILSQVDRLSEMVAHMRAISRRESMAQQPFFPELALSSALKIVEPLLKADGIEVSRQGDLVGIKVLGHQVRLEQVLLNLLNNARDSLREHGQPPAQITVTCQHEPHDNRVSITIRDNGPGIPPAMARQIFEPFFTTKPEGAGCGLGLSISRTICSEMAGGLSFANMNPGAAFTVSLPMMERPAHLSNTQSSPLMPPLAGATSDDVPDDEDEDWSEERRLLLVDDEAISVMMVGEFLERQGYKVDTAYDGLAALALCQTHVYDAVITDIRMPRMDGHELVVRLAELQPGTPVIVVTGHLQESDAADLGPNVAAMLEKPFQLNALRDILLRMDDEHSYHQKQ